MPLIIYIAIPVFFLTMALERAWSRPRRGTATGPAGGVIKGYIRSFHPVHIAFHEWRAMLTDAWRAGSVRHALGFLLRGPGWHPDGGTTSRALQARRSA